MKRKYFKNMFINAGLMAILITTVGIYHVHKNTMEQQPIPVSITEEESIIEPVVLTHSMDFVEPRQDITDEFDILKPSNVSREDLVRALDDEFRRGLLPAVDAVIAAEKAYGVNAIYLISTLGIESGWGKYSTGTYNIAGWKTLSGGWRDFESITECVLTVAEGLATSFKNDVGSILKDVTNRYCQDEGYLDQLKEVMHNIENKIY